MDLKQYFRKVREIEASIAAAYVVVVSLETSDGGKPGVCSEVSREAAAKLIAEGRAALADEHTAKHFYDAQACAREAAEKAQLAKRLQVAIIPEGGSQGELSVHTKPIASKK
ncbi:MAG: hypothetical protein JO270_05105 [Acidobacteriaceae bacterium]|nr:hypothetical protein [Acidobacteriaceae bacterium]MBV8573070.1 hypothetical protein [Acidobacteriaceae bacterium]